MVFIDFPHESIIFVDFVKKSAILVDCRQNVVSAFDGGRSESNFSVGSVVRQVRTEKIEKVSCFEINYSSETLKVK
jgi:hypothetical protein